MLGHYSKGRGLNFPVKTERSRFNKLFIIWLFAWLLQARNWVVSITGDSCPSMGALYRPFAAKPSRDLLFIKLWAIT